MKFCAECQSLLYLKKTPEKQLVYECKYCGKQEPRKEGTMCVYSSKSDGDYMTYQMAKNQYTIRDPTLPRLSNVKCINSNCLTNHETSLILINSHNTNTESFIGYIKNILVKNNIPEDNLELRELSKDEIEFYGEVHGSGGPLTMSDLPDSILPTLQVLTFANLKEHKTCIEILEQGSISEDNLLPKNHTLTKDPNYPEPILSQILREVISIKYDEINMKYMYICTTCGSSWKNLA
jgi:DNA-directed RNA polymerase subunit M/transcription elongation factor TFIIS